MLSNPGYKRLIVKGVIENPRSSKPRGNPITMINGGDAVFWPNTKRAQDLRKVQAYMRKLKWIDPYDDMVWRDWDWMTERYYARQPTPAIFVAEVWEPHANGRWHYVHGYILAAGYNGQNVVTLLYSPAWRIGIAVHQELAGGARAKRKRLRAIADRVWREQKQHRNSEQRRHKQLQLIADRIAQLIAQSE